MFLLCWMYIAQVSEVQIIVHFWACGRCNRSVFQRELNICVSMILSVRPTCRSIQYNSLFASLESAHVSYFIKIVMCSRKIAYMWYKVKMYYCQNMFLKRTSHFNDVTDPVGNGVLMHFL